MKKLIYRIMFIPIIGTLTSCTLPVKSVKPLQGPPVEASSTPYSQALICVGAKVPEHKRIALAVDHIPDRTGKYSIYEGGYKVTQGAEDISISALGKTNAYLLVDRTSMRVPMMEIRYANKYLLRDINPRKNMKIKGGYARKLNAGELIGSDYTLTGSITEINYNIDSGGFDLSINGIGGGWRAFNMDVAIDLRLTNTRTSQIVMVMPLRKQLWGYENKLGITRFFGQTLVAANAGRKRQEPINLAVRSVIEAGIVTMTQHLYNIPSTACTAEIANAERYVARDAKVAKNKKITATPAIAQSLPPPIVKNYKQRANSNKKGKI